MEFPVDLDQSLLPIDELNQICVELVGVTYIELLSKSRENITTLILDKPARNLENLIRILKIPGSFFVYGEQDIPRIVDELYGRGVVFRVLNFHKLEDIIHRSAEIATAANLEKSSIFTRLEQ